MSSAVAERPGAAAEIRVVALHATRGINYWSRRPVIRMDVQVGAFEHISSADAVRFTERLIAILPGLEAHECSIGAPGGLVLRLQRERTHRTSSSTSHWSCRRSRDMT